MGIGRFEDDESSGSGQNHRLGNGSIECRNGHKKLSGRRITVQELVFGDKGDN